jgi:hypothetical protein
MTQNPIPPTEQRHATELLDARIGHVRGPDGAQSIVEYGDYECRYSRLAYRSIERLEAQLSEGLRFAFRHFPLTEIHPRARRSGRRRGRGPAGPLQGDAQPPLWVTGRRSRARTCVGTPPNSASTWRSSTATARAWRRCGESTAMSRAS